MSAPIRHLLMMNKECPVLVLLQEPPINEDNIYINASIQSKNESYAGPIKIIYAKNCERWSYYIANDDDDLNDPGTEVTSRNGYKKVKSKFRNCELDIQENFNNIISDFQQLIDVEEHPTADDELTARMTNGILQNDKVQCDICSQVFTKASTFTRHMKHNHESSDLQSV